MVNSTKALLREALALPDLERADLAAALLASLDQPSHEDLTEVSTLWREELEKRANCVLSNEIRFGSEATAELEDAARWYEQRHVGLGLEFLAA
jgi:hypothetical protein